jgi:zinc protease
MILKSGAGSTRPGGDVAKEIRALGGSFEAKVEFDHATFTVTAPAPQWKKALETEARALLEPALEEAAWAREAGFLARGSGDEPAPPERKEFGRLLELAFDRRGAGGTASGSPSGGLSISALAEYQRAACAPGRMFLVVCGDVSTSEILREVVRLYGKAKGAAEKGGARAEPGEGLRYREVRGDLADPRVQLGFVTSPASSDDWAALRVLQAMLGLGEGSILPRRLRDQKKVILEGSADLVALAGAGFLAVEMDVAPENLDRAEIAAFTEVELLKRSAPERLDLERALAQLERVYWLGLSTVEERAHALGRFEALEGWKAMNDSLRRLRAVKPEDIPRVARKYLRLEGASLVEHLPASSEPRNVSGEVIARTIRELLQASADQEAAAREAETVPAIVIPEPGAAFKPTEVRYPMQKASVLRGPELFIKEDHTSPLVEMGIFYPGGKLLETGENAGVTSLTLSAMLRGGKPAARDQMVQQLEVYGGRIEPVVEDDYFGFRLTVLSRSVESALDLVFGMFKGAKFEPDDVARQKALELAALRGSRRCRSPRALVEENLFGDFPYGRCRYGTGTSLSSLAPDAVTACYKSNIEYRRPVVVIVGDTEGTSLARYFVRSFSGSRYQDAKLPESAPKLPAKRSVREESREEPRSASLVGFGGPPDGDEDSYPLIVLARLASGSGGRLQDELHDRQGVADSAALEYAPRLRGASIIARVSSAPALEEKALSALEAELRRLAEAPILYRDYRTAVNLAAGSYWIDHQARGAQIDRMVRFFLAGKGVDEINNHPGRLQAVREEDLPEVARRFLDPQRAVVLRSHGKER